MESTDQSRLLHDLTHLLTMVSALAESLRSRLPPDQPVTADSIELARTIERALAVARRGTMRGSTRLVARGAIDVDQYIDRMTPRLTHVVGSRLNLVIRTGGPTGSVRANREQLDRILLNLMFNASATTRDGGRVTVETSASDYLMDDDAQRGRPPRRYARLSVHDSGCGIPVHLQEQITDPSTATTAETSSLGLDSVARTVRQLDGRLQIESAEGVGTSVHVDLPLL
jgi:signal transduction histidine kinase